MATITTILGTDSLSASRVTLNDNFSAINTELTSVTALLDPTTNNLTGVVDAEVETLSVDGGAAAAFAATGNTLTADTQVDGAIEMNNAVIYDKESVDLSTGSMPAALGFTKSSYVITDAGSGSITLNDAEEGQQITIVAAAGAISVANPTAVAGVVTSIDIDQYGTLTLRFIGGDWYVVGSFLATIV